MGMVSVASSGDPLERVVALIPSIQSRAARLDDAAEFPTEDVAALRDAGILSLPLPIEDAVADPKSRAALVDRLADVLVNVGVGNLALGRIVEAHINARQLIARYGSSIQQAIAANDVRDGHLFALWVTDAPGDGLRIAAGRGEFQLRGRKMFCSAAGYATRAVVSASDECGRHQMLMVALNGGEWVEPLEAPLQGMRSAVTGTVDFTGCTVPEKALLGSHGDYLREPDFSAGAWRGSAVALGGLRALLDVAKEQLGAAGRLDNAHQLERLGRAMIALETSRLWLRQAAWIAECPPTDVSQAVAYVGLARIAVETACLDAMRLVQRSLGLSAFRRGNPVERICRDLGTYLRQPAPDEVLTEAAAYFACRPMPGSP
jgi:alkylation response protein AidB-like acyl-CoA dehydrogenase